jgi:Nif-specific regulatory protein
LRILQEGEFERVGGQHTLKVNFRLVCATNRNLEELVKQEKFRADLYYRISVVPLIVPPLRERPGDIPELAAHFLEKFGEENGLDLHFASTALNVLTHCAFPGNVRELENCVRRTAALAAGAEIQGQDFACQQGKCLSAALWNKPGCSPGQCQPIAKPSPLPAAPAHSPSSTAGPAPGLPPVQAEAESRTPATDDAAAGQGAYQEFSKDTLIQAMEKTGWVQAKAARLLGLTPRQMGYALKKHGIEIKHF